MAFRAKISSVGIEFLLKTPKTLENEISCMSNGNISLYYRTSDRVDQGYTEYVSQRAPCIRLFQIFLEVP